MAARNIKLQTAQPFGASQLKDGRFCTFLQMEAVSLICPEHKEQDLFRTKETELLESRNCGEKRVKCCTVSLCTLGRQVALHFAAAGGD